MKKYFSDTVRVNATPTTCDVLTTSSQVSGRKLVEYYMKIGDLNKAITKQREEHL